MIPDRWSTGYNLVGSIRLPWRYNKIALEFSRELLDKYQHETAKYYSLFAIDLLHDIAAILFLIKEALDDIEINATAQFRFRDLVAASVRAVDMMTSTLGMSNVRLLDATHFEYRWKDATYKAEFVPPDSRPAAEAAWLVDQEYAIVMMYEWNLS